MVFIPFDASEDEITQLSVIRSPLPPDLRSPLRSWLRSVLLLQGIYPGTDYINISLGHDLQTALQRDFGLPANGFPELNPLLDQLFSEQKLLFRAVDYLLSQMQSASSSKAGQLARMLDQSRAKYAVDMSNYRPRLTMRLVDGIEETVQEAVNASDTTAGQLLATAWSYAFGMEPKPQEAMDAAVKAAERAVTPIICPVHPKPSLGIAARVVMDQKDWDHGLRVDGGFAPANETIYCMLQTLWAGQQYRHVDQHAIPPTVEQARTHVMLAATIVGWFSSGSVGRSGKAK